MADEPGNFRLDKFADGKGGWYFIWTLTTDLGQSVATSERFPDRPAAEKAIKWVKDNVAKCTTLEPPQRASIA